MDSTIQNVSDTALWVAVYRAQESERPDALFRDPYAGLLAGERGRQIAQSMSYSAIMSWIMVSRTTLIDGMIESLLKEGVDLVLNLGAGLDTRPYRMNLPSGLRWIEADFPHMIEYKNEKLAAEKPKCRLERVAVDLSEQPARDRLFDRVNAEAKRVLVISEGVLPYLTPEQGAELADALAAWSHFKYWIQDWYGQEAMRNTHRAHRDKMKNAPFQFKVDDWFRFFAAHGWDKRESVSLYDQSVKTKRPFKGPLLWRLLLKLPGAKRRFRRSSGCAILQRH